MSVKKKVVSVILSMLLVLSFSTTIFAGKIEDFTTLPSYQTSYTFNSFTTNNVVNLGFGATLLKGPSSGTVTVKGTMYLDRNSNGSWINVTSKSISYDYGIGEQSIYAGQANAGNDCLCLQNTTYRVRVVLSSGSMSGWYLRVQGNAID